MARRCPLSLLLLLLLMFQASASSQAAWVPHNLIFPQIQSFEPQNGGASAAPITLATAAVSTGLKNSTRDSDPAALNTLVSMFCGLLLIKILMLVYLLPRWDLDWEQMEQRTCSVMVAQNRNLPESRGP